MPFNDEFLRRYWGKFYGLEAKSGLQPEQPRVDFKVHFLPKSVQVSATLSLLFANVLSAQIEHGTLDVSVYGDPPTVSLLPGASPSVAIPQVNFGDYWLTFDESQATQKGVLITSVAENGHDGDYATSSAEIEHVDTDPLYLEYSLTIHRSNSGGGDEMNIDSAFAFFPYDQFLGGLTQNPGNGQAFDTILGSETTGITLGNQFNENAAGPADDADGAYTLDLRSLDSDATPANGILLVSGGKNEDNFALSQANTDTFTLFTHDNYVNGADYERDPIAFVYLPTNKEHIQIPALGRIDDDGSPIVSRGDFTVTKTGEDKPWHLEIPGHSPNTGTLIISPEGGDGNNIDNIISYEWDPDQRHWVIESRDLIGLSIQSVDNVPAFSFAFITKPPLYVDKNATGTNDGSSWENAYTELWDAARNATAGDQIWVAAGNHRSSRTAFPDTDDSIELRTHVKIYGGFNGSETLLSQRNPNPATNQTVITGELGDPNDPSDNTYHVIYAGIQTSGYNLLDGFTITGGNARSAFAPGDSGAGLLIKSSLPIEVANCRFLSNTSLNLGGAVYITPDADVTFRNCSFKGNEADEGGALFIDSQADVKLYSSVLQGNFARQTGSAIVQDGGKLRLTNCSLQGNRSIVSSPPVHKRSQQSTATLEILDSIVWGNQPSDWATADSDLPVFYGFGNATVIASILQHIGINKDLDGTDSRLDPRFAEPIDPQTAPSTAGSLAPKSRSPLIDNGATFFQVGERDVLGFPRLVGSNIDIGAHEHFPVLEQVSDVGALTASSTSIDSWIQPEKLTNTTISIIPLTTSGDIAFDVLPTLDPNSGELSFTLSPATSGFATFTVSLIRTDQSNAPFYIDFTIKTAGQTLYVDPFAYGGDHSGSSWENAQPTLATALEYSQTGDSIHVATGKYRPDAAAAYETDDRDATFPLKTGVALYGGFPSGGAAFAQRDYETNETILDGRERFQHLVTGSGTDATAILDGFSIRDGLNDNTRGGAGIINDNGSPTIANCRFTDNITNSKGGAIANLNGSSPSIENSFFSDNQGSAIANFDDSNPTISDCDFIDNYGAITGGAIYNQNSSPQIISSLFRNHEANQGGAIYNLDSSPILSLSLFQENHSNSNGGAIYNQSSSPTFNNCQFVLNHSENNGGAFFFVGSGTTTLQDCDFTENKTENAGGAIYKSPGTGLVVDTGNFTKNTTNAGSGGALYLSAGPANLKNVQFKDNRSAGQGGAIYSFLTDLSIEQSTFLGNRSTSRGGALMADESTVTIDTSKFHANRADNRGGAIDTAQETTLQAANSVFVNNYSTNGSGGAIAISDETNLALLNSAVVENIATQGGGIWAESPVLLTNSILWDNKTKLFVPSHVEGTGGFDPASSNNIIQGQPGGFDPLFVLAPDPVENPKRALELINFGNLRLRLDSPAVNAGVNPTEPSTLDLGGNPRIQDSTIDIGPYEGYRNDYFYLFGHLDPDGDRNGNGQTNYHDYAAGLDPEYIQYTNTNPQFSETEDGFELTFSQRINREDVFVQWQKSTTLEPNSWSPMILDTDYVEKEETVTPTSQQNTVTLTPNESEDQIFYRQVFSQLP